MSTERPILFSGEMVNAIFEGRKVQTRRIVKPQPVEHDFQNGGVHFSFVPPQTQKGYLAIACHVIKKGDTAYVKMPFGHPGSHLWVREGLHRPDGDPWLYRADNQPVVVAKEDETAMLVWAHHKVQDYCPSMFMPRWAARITLEIVNVRVERLESISEEDAKAEGVTLEPCTHPDCGPGSRCAADSYRGAFAVLWNKINGKKHPWGSNPFVWVIEFKRVSA